MHADTRTEATDWTLAEMRDIADDYADYVNPRERGTDCPATMDA